MATSTTKDVSSMENEESSLHHKWLKNQSHQRIKISLIVDVGIRRGFHSPASVRASNLAHHFRDHHWDARRCLLALVIGVAPKRFGRDCHFRMRLD